MTEPGSGAAQHNGERGGISLYLFVSPSQCSASNAVHGTQQPSLSRKDGPELSITATGTGEQRHGTARHEAEDGTSAAKMSVRL